MSSKWSTPSFDKDPVNLDQAKPILMETELPLEMYNRGNRRIYLDTILKNSPLIRVKAYIPGIGIVTVTNETVNGLLSIVDGKNKKQINDDSEVFFDPTTVYEFKQRGLTTKLLLPIEIELDDDNSGIREIEQKVSNEVAEVTIPPKRKARFK